MRINYITILLTLLNFIILAAIIGGIITGIILLQIFLSKKESKLLGLILPIVNLSFTLLITFAFVFYDAAYTENKAEYILRILFMFIMLNIPTIIFFGIYESIRKKLVKTNEINKMTIQDLN